MSGESPGPAGCQLPGCNEELESQLSVFVHYPRRKRAKVTNRVNEGAHVEEYSIESDYAHGLLRIRVDDIAGRYHVSDLDCSRD
jgi:hypothetical protein